MIDSHCHLTDPYYGGGEDIIKNMAADGLEALVTVGYDARTSAECARLAANDGVYATVGLHPGEIKEGDDLGGILPLLRLPKVVALGEIGLDYFYDLSPREVQKDAFFRQIALAEECGLPVCLHVRDAYGDCLEALKECEPMLKNGVLLHCYSGSREMVREFSRLDAYFAFGGAITFKNEKKNVEALAAVPRDRLLLETDCPYMAPVPYRGKTNFPKYVALVRDKAAEVTGMSAEEVERITAENTKRLFKRMK